MEDLKNKVVNQLVKWGNNESEVIKMINLHFDYASKHYTSAKKIAECIKTIA